MVDAATWGCVPAAGLIGSYLRWRHCDDEDAALCIAGEWMFAGGLFALTLGFFAVALPVVMVAAAPPVADLIWLIGLLRRAIRWR